ncbi:MAG: DUF2760 domain-containing protein [Kofleriaceae bacterium]|jgi:hypothetical protein|nr:DUF2760 domain-containing protein [Kofleriaceae bacterium]MBP9172201.1 DUF2760 domain-containing protein [Kofleriaceae bacterium]MBP9863038.1 DUF2760 domain-containing protein [Kofleriaceae bacterium]
MSRIGLAFSSFFRLLFGKPLRPEVAAFLPEPARLPPPADPGPKAAKPEPADPGPKAAKPEPADPGPKAAKPEPGARPEPAPAPRKADGNAHRDGALALLALLQRDGRLIDFLREPLDGFSDADIGAAARDVHRGCKKVLDQYVTLEPVMAGADDAPVTVPKGFDPAEVRLIGEAKGEPPFRGALRHHGWRATKAQLPTLTDGVDRTIVAPAEVELS